MTAITKAFLIPLALLAWLPAAKAFASGDFTCEPVWAVKHVQVDDCSNTAFLSPGNDSRVNLQMLMLDRQGLALRPAPGQSPDAALFSLDDFSTALQAALTGKPPPAPGEPGSSNDLAEGEGSRCISNDSGAAGFTDALDHARGLPPDERTALAAARHGLSPSCNGGAAKALEADPPAVKSATGKAFAAYLAGAAAFYDGDFDAAHAAFAPLAASNVAWVREAARYMLARVELNRAQVNAFEQYSDKPAPAKVDAAALTAAQSGFAGYLRDYPKGDYAASARGLLRRVDWLGGKTGKLSEDYARLMAASDLTADATARTLAQEIDNKLLDDAEPAAITAPELLAASDLMRMRSADEPAAPTSPADAAARPSLTLAELQAQRPVFAKAPALFDYLLAAHHFYVGADAAGALALLPARPAGASASYVAFSREVLRGEALEAQRDRGARAHWTALYAEARRPGQKGLIQLALALDHQQTGDLDAIFAPGSVISNADMRTLVLQYDAAAPLLRARASASDAGDDERRTALYVLLYKELTHAQYAAFLKDQPLLAKAPPPKAVEGQAPNDELATFAWPGAANDAEAGYKCPALREVAQVLAQRPADPHARMCLAEFVREEGLDGFFLNKQRPAGQLGGGPPPFAGPDPARLETYKAVIADPKAPVADKTYALYRAVNCYGPSGYNHCDGTDVPIAQRKAWFRTLKTTYASSPWAAALKYYW